MGPLYIRGVNLLDLRRVLVVEVLARSAPLATPLEDSFADLKITSHTLYKVHSDHLPAPLSP